MLTLEQLLAHFEGTPQRAGGGHNVRCPAHEDRQASLSIKKTEDKFLLHCQAGCTFDAVIAAAQLTAKDLFKSHEPRVIATYDYRDETSKIVYQVQRWEPKRFTQRRPDGDKWVNNLQGVERIPYRLPEVVRSKQVIIVEGEKDVDNLRKWGYVATTTGSASSWKPELAKYFTRKVIYIIADADAPGRAYANKIAESLHNDNSVSILEMSKGKDVSDWMAAGGTPDELKALLDAAALWKDPKDLDIADDFSLHLNDMPEQVLDGYLGEIAQRRMGRFPLAYSWLALAAVAGVMVRRSLSTLRQNLFASLVGPVHTGKSQAIEHAVQVLGIGAPELQKLMSGSAEGMLGRLKDANGCARLVSVDEMGHLLSKAHIENASFPYVLNRAFYETSFDVTGAKGKLTSFHCEMSLLGGCPDNLFDTLFDASTVGGLYDRFVFGICPQPFTFDYRPFEGGAEPITETVAVGIDPEVWEMKRIWVEEGVSPRCAENALRIAGICASLDKRTLLRPAQLGPAFAFAKYQTRIQQTLRPNPGENSDAKCAFAILTTLERMAQNGSKGKWIARRACYKAIHAERLGPSVFRRALDSLVMNGDIEICLDANKKAFYRAGDFSS